MKFKYYQIDAFSDKVFGGNPACVVPLQNWLSDDLLLKITQENAVAETAFFIDNGESFNLRWFTPELEMDLCGHATLAAAHVIKTILDFPLDEMVFATLSGDLKVTCHGGWYDLNLPSRPPIPAELPKEVQSALNIQPQEVYKSRDYMLVYKNEQEIKDIQLNRQLFDQINLGCGGVVVTSKGDTSDFVSRFFTPQTTILEDPVTGSAHCTLIPFWSTRLKKKNLLALQLSERGGKLACRDIGERIVVGGQATTYSSGEFFLR